MVQEPAGPKPPPSVPDPSSGSEPPKPGYTEEDLTATEQASAEPPSRPTTKLVEAEDLVRARIAYWLLALLTFVVVFACGFLLLRGWGKISGSEDELSKLLNQVFGPLITLVSSATGFYYGARTAARARSLADSGETPSQGAGRT
jgi:hypothetical protein